MAEDKDRLERNYALACKRLAETGGKSAKAAENYRGQMYQALVRAGLRPQIRYRYRVPKG